MRKAAKVVIAIVIAIVGFFVFVAVVASTVPIGTTYEVSSQDEVAGISDFVVLKDGSFYRARFSLMNNNSGIVTSDVNATFTVTPTLYGTNAAPTTAGQNQTILYQR